MESMEEHFRKMEEHVEGQSECQQLEGIHWKEATWRKPSKEGQADETKSEKANYVICMLLKV